MVFISYRNTLPIILSALTTSGYSYLKRLGVRLPSSVCCYMIVGGDVLGFSLIAP